MYTTTITTKSIESSRGQDQATYKGRHYNSTCLFNRDSTVRKACVDALQNLFCSSHILQPEHSFSSPLAVLPHFSSEKGRPPMNINQTHIAGQVAVRLGTIPTIKAEQGNPGGGKGSQKMTKKLIFLV